MAFKHIKFSVNLKKNVYEWIKTKRLFMIYNSMKIKTISF